MGTSTSSNQKVEELEINGDGDGLHYVVNIIALPNDVIKNILCFMDPQSIVKFSMTCKRMKNIVSDDSFWRMFLKTGLPTDVVDDIDIDLYHSYCNVVFSIKKFSKRLWILGQSGSIAVRVIILDIHSSERSPYTFSSFRPAFNASVSSISSKSSSDVGYFSRAHHKGFNSHLCNHLYNITFFFLIQLQSSVFSLHPLYDNFNGAAIIMAYDPCERGSFNVLVEGLEALSLQRFPFPPFLIWVIGYKGAQGQVGAVQVTLDEARKTILDKNLAGRVDAFDSGIEIEIALVNVLNSWSKHLAFIHQLK